jgi:cobalt-zinc-cadmium efflux system outer membrane protein
LQGFAELGLQIPLFNRNQGNVEAARAELERSRLEADRIRLRLTERASTVFQNYLSSRAAVERYRTEMLPRARRAFELYVRSYQNMAAAYPQVLIAQRTWFQLQTDYISALETLWTNSIAIRSFLLIDGLEEPSRPGEIGRVREINLPIAGGAQAK